MKNITINDIARELGLSRNTVSKVLNGKEMPEKTKRLVLEKAKELNYKQLSDEEHKRFKILLLAGKPLTNYHFYIPILRELENECYQRGDQLFQHVCQQGENAATYLKDNIGSLSFDGIICIEFFDKSLIKAILNFKVPTVFVDSPVEMYAEGHFDVILQDNYTPLEAELNRLVEKCGVKKIGFVGDPNHCLSFRERYETVLITNGLHDLQHKKAWDLLFPDGHTVYHNRYLMVRELKNRQLCDAYVCVNDYIARQFINALTVIGLNVPKDIKVIGFDGTPEATSLKPSISTIMVDPSNLAKTMLFVMRNRILHNELQKTLCVVRTTFIAKDSTE